MTPPLETTPIETTPIETTPIETTPIETTPIETLPTRHVAQGDGERCRPGTIAQPVNTASSLSYVIAGALMLRTAHARRTGRPSESALGWATIGVGLGSIAYHGPGTAAGRYLHDSALIAMLGLVALADVEELAGAVGPPALVAAVPAVAAALATHPGPSMVGQAVAGLAAVAGETARLTRRSGPERATWRGLVEVGVATAGAVAHLLGRTGGPWSRPDGLLQPHAAWHVATAAALWLRSLDVHASPVGS